MTHPAIKGYPHDELETSIYTIIISYYWPILTTINHYQPLLTIINHYEPLFDKPTSPPWLHQVHPKEVLRLKTVDVCGIGQPSDWGFQLVIGVPKNGRFTRENPIG